MSEIPGWFTFQGWYERVAQEAPPGSTLVELGVFCGKSLAYLAQATKAKGCRVIGVDTFRGSPEFADVVKGAGGATDWKDIPTGQLAQEAIHHLTVAGVIEDVTLIVSDSAKAASLFADESVWMVFVDADHAADAVERDVRAWWPKVKPGGWLAGDDYSPDFPGVREGLERAFPGAELPTFEGLQSTTWTLQK